MVMKVQADPQEKLRSALREASKQVQDLTVPLGLITQQWFKSNAAIFTLGGPGKYVDLSEIYKKQKSKAVGFVYPILKRTGKLSESITDPRHTNSIALVVNKNSLTLGTNVTYAQFLDKGTSKMPARPVVLFGNEQVAPKALNRRIKQWEKMILDYALEVSGGKPNG